MNVSKATVSCVRLSNAFLSKRWYAKKPPPQQGQVHPGYIKIRELYKKWQVNDGVPIHLKGGPLDKFLFYSTIFGCFFGTVWMFMAWYPTAFPRKR